LGFAAFICVLFFAFSASLSFNREGGWKLIVQELLDRGARALPKREGIPDPRREALWLLAHAWGADEMWLRMRSEVEVPDEVEHRFEAWLQRRAAGEPAHHLSGSCTFLGRSFEVSSGVLVPRPESELVIQTALELPLALEAKVLDVGTGSGCLAITLALERPRWRTVAVDSSMVALGVARSNRDLHVAQIDLICGDLGHAVAGGFDLVVANLPYIPTDRLVELPPEVQRDPPLALDGGPDGLTLVRGLLHDLERLLKPCGGAVLELGEGQSGAVTEVAQRAGLGVARRIRDVGGCERVMVLQRR